MGRWYRILLRFSAPLSEPPIRTTGSGRGGEVESWPSRSHNDGMEAITLAEAVPVTGQTPLFSTFPVLPGQKFLCLGDSITEAHPGYVDLLEAAFQALYPEHNIEVINAGISGNRVVDLWKRLHRDVIDRLPSWITIYIGVNDVWHDFLPNVHGVSLDEYIRVYDQILTTLQQRLAGAHLLLFTPTCIGESPDTPENQRLVNYVAAVHHLGEEHHLPVIDLNAIFWRTIQAGRATNPEYHLTMDGVHPTLTGHYLIAHTLLRALAAV